MAINHAAVIFLCVVASGPCRKRVPPHSWFQATIKCFRERREMADILWRATVILHRYLGIAIGLLMVMWFVSGIVMIYVPFTRVADTERLRFQPPISWQLCCQYGGLSDQAQITRAQVEDHLGVPALRLRIPGQQDSLFDLAHGARLPIGADVARKVVSEAAPGIMGRPASIIAYEQVPYDQFTLGRGQRDRPLHRFGFDDPEKTI